MKEPPIELTEYKLCQTFGWTLSQLDRQPLKKVMRFIDIMNAEDRQRKITEQQDGH